MTKCRSRHTAFRGATTSPMPLTSYLWTSPNNEFLNNWKTISFCGSVTLTTFLWSTRILRPLSSFLYATTFIPTFTSRLRSLPMMCYHAWIWKREWRKSASHTLYMKSSHSNVTIPWCFHYPKYILINVLCDELRRAHNNGTNSEERAKGVNLIKERYTMIGYPQRVIQQTLRPCALLRDPVLRPKTFLILPFFSEQQVREVRNLLKECNLSNYLTVSFKSATLSCILGPS